MKKFFVFLVVLLADSMMPMAARSYMHENGNFLVSCIVHDNRNIYVGTRHGLVVVDKTTDVQTVYNSSNSALPEDGVYTLALLGDTLLIGQENCRYSTLCDGQFTNYQMVIPEVHILNPSSVEVMDAPVASFAVKAGCQQVYIAELDAFASVSEGKVLEGFSVPTSLLEGSIEDMRLDSEGTLWIVSSSGGYKGNCGLCRYTKDGGVDFFLEDYDDNMFPMQTGKREMYSLCVEVTPDGHVWTGIRDGYLAEFDGKGFSFHPTGTASEITGMCLDDKGALWCISEQGLLLSYDGRQFVGRQLVLNGERCDCLDVDGDVVYVGTNKRLLRLHNDEEQSIDLQLPGATDVLNIKQNSMAASTSIHQMFWLTPGIYIKNGRKILFR